MVSVILVIGIRTKQAPTTTKDTFIHNTELRARLLISEKMTASSGVSSIDVFYTSYRQYDS